MLAAAFIALGFLIYPLTARVGVMSMGTGSVIMGMVVLIDLPNGLAIESLVLFGFTVVVGLWMVYVGVKNG
ncbi:MAG TPA: hypothetical protein PLY52_09615 [Methanothrix sp.]|nr:hypothetical protein [Methanothrix sp.]